MQSVNDEKNGLLTVLLSSLEIRIPVLLPARGREIVFLFCLIS